MEALFGSLVSTSDLAGEFADRVIEAFHTRPEENFTMALTGVGNVETCYKRLADLGSREIDWWRVDVYWTEDFCVSRDEPGSSYRVVMENLLQRVGAANAVYPLDCTSGAQSYQLRLADLGKLDLVVLSLRPDGGLAGLPPVFDPSQSEPGELVCQIEEADGNPGVLTLTPAGLSRARLAIVTVAGDGPKAAFDALLRGKADKASPALSLRAERVLWMVAQEPS
jgi:6-phosphogluconolactonase